MIPPDVATISGVPWRGKVGLIVASPPCQAYSYRAMPWNSLKAERKRCENRITEIDALLGEMGTVAQPKRGRPRKAAELKGA